MIIYLTTRLCRAVYNAFTKPPVKTSVEAEFDDPVTKREALLKILVEQRAMPAHWYDILNNGVISPIVHVPEFDLNTSQEEYVKIQDIESELYCLQRRFAELGAFAEGSKYYDLADFIRISANAMRGARQHYEQLRFGGGTHVKEPRIVTLSDYTETPGGRYVSDGPHSGEWFRETVISPKFEAAQDAGEKLKVNMNDVYGLPPSFLEEVFGGLRRKYGLAEVLQTLEVVATDDPRAAEDIVKFIHEEP